jgi:DNA-binding beta-propeller fold protein YncE
MSRRWTQTALFSVASATETASASAQSSAAVLQRRRILAKLRERDALTPEAKRFPVVRAAVLLTAVLATSLTAEEMAPSGRPWLYADHSYVAIDEELLVLSQPRHHAVLLFHVGRVPPELLRVIGTQGTGAGQFVRPTGVAISAARGLIAVSDAGNDRIQLFGLERGEAGEVLRVSFAKSSGRRGHEHGTFDAPEGLTFDREGNLYVCDAGNRRIQMLDAQLRFVREWRGGLGKERLELPLAIAISPAGDRVYVADGGNPRLHVFDRWGKAVGSREGGTATRGGALAYPFGLAVGSDGAVYVTDSRRHVVQQLDAQGNFVSEWGQPGQEPGRFFQPEGVAIDARGRLLVVDFGGRRGQWFSPSGVLLEHFSIPPGDLAPPIPAVSSGPPVTASRSCSCGPSRSRPRLIHLKPPRLGTPAATRNMTLFPLACGEKKSVTSSSKKVSPVAPRPSA